MSCFREPWSLCALPEMCEPSLAVGRLAQCMLPWKGFGFSTSVSQIQFYFTKHLSGPVSCTTHQSGAIAAL